MKLDVADGSVLFDDYLFNWPVRTELDIHRHILNYSFMDVLVFGVTKDDKNSPSNGPALVVVNFNSNAISIVKLPVVGTDGTQKMVATVIDDTYSATEITIFWAGTIRSTVDKYFGRFTFDLTTDASPVLVEEFEHNVDKFAIHSLSIWTDPTEYRVFAASSNFDSNSLLL